MEGRFGEGRGNEQEKEYTSRVILHIFRHGEKGPKPEGGTDYDVRLSKEGRQKSRERYRPGTNLEQSIAYGSPRDRAQETAGLAMSGSSAESLEELQEELDADLKYGSKIGRDPRLNANFEPKSPYTDEFESAYKKGQVVKFLVEDSDKVAQEVNDKESFTYHRGAKQFAGILQKFIRVANQWDFLQESSRWDEKLVQNPGKRYEDPTLERFLGSHSPIVESFLAAAIEVTRGKEERDRFVEKATSGGKGFNLLEGFGVEIQSQTGAEPTIHIHYIKEKDGEAIYEFDENLIQEDINRMANLGVEQT